MELKVLAALASGAALVYSFGDLLAAHLREQRRELIISKKQDLLQAYRYADELEDEYGRAEEDVRLAQEAVRRAEAEYRASLREQAREQQVASR